VKFTFITDYNVVLRNLK